MIDAVLQPVAREQCNGFAAPARRGLLRTDETVHKTTALSARRFWLDERPPKDCRRKLRGELGSRQPPQQLLHDVRAHGAVQQRLFGLFGQGNGFVVADVALLQ